ncbi:ABC transporter permease [Xylocopilactobacillus apis]|uniref:ABC transporter permease n=1 Tax=Xylocopilactobacillus apis TaxID=2932183 RepID=A0AAU9DE32_9LACO|nr:ABC transporter permease [Xylocopilactobacillus apis]BDR56401.1 ABC transporter permease [Xylocopilactobacillus apis]
MKKIYHNRFQENLANNSKYLRYVFNDHFILILFILMGYLAYLYSQNLNSILSLNPYLLRAIIAIIFFIELNSFNYVTLLKRPDQSFLLPAISKFKENFAFATTYSMALPTITFALSSLAVFPIINKLDHTHGPFVWILILAGLICLQLALFNSFKSKIYGKFSGLKFNISILFLNLIVMIPIVVGKYYLFLGLSFLYLILSAAIDKIKKESIFKVDFSIDSEIRRQSRINKFYSLFVDLPDSEIQIKRRKYLDFVKSNKSSQKNLFWKTFLRAGNYLGLFLRLLLINVIILLLFRNSIFSLILSFILLYLLLFQLIPIYQQVISNFWFRIFPTKKSNWIKLFQKFLIEIGVTYTIINSLVMMDNYHYNFINAFIFLGGGIVFTILITKLYITSRIRKIFNH